LYEHNISVQKQVCVIHANLFSKDNLRSAEADLEEAISLSKAIDLSVVFADVIQVKEIRPATYIGKGALEKLADRVKEEDLELAIFNCQLSPVQQRNLEKSLNCKVIDRTALILEIFGARASTKEGSLQVELAHLSYQRGRLVRSWTHLERQRGGSGFLGGPGETQIELDRRVITDRITQIKKEIEKVKNSRELHRKARKKVPFPVVALVGYTNAGKSTLFNKLTSAEVFAEDMLFATLDPTMRELKLSSSLKIILSDTVGFVSNLPTELVAAFRATLEEVLSADLIIHVRDISHPDTNAQKNDVEAVLRDLGLSEQLEKDEIIEAYNKIDLLSEEEHETYKNISYRKENICALSAISGEGTDALLSLIKEKMLQKTRTVEITLDAHDGANISWLHDRSEIVSKEFDDNVVKITARMETPVMARFLRSNPDVEVIEITGT